ncbi:protein mono-ADP-ribosyltransferase PARP14-like [Spea bombifrons]|uniref:protein mono-ADP-ribosyltransferase PARP14-like n=1 Tax=Spea bombifrons TaxID=233779 RepID=UPI00234AD54B|nr:protein mono-ADP-ribosyltransferase PARP14-like [Spea bombifrons]
MEEYPYSLNVRCSKELSDNQTSHLQRYFSLQRKSRGGENKVSMLSSKLFKVSFQEQKVMERVLSHKEHSIQSDGELVSLVVYLEGVAEKDLMATPIEDEMPTLAGSGGYIPDDDDDAEDSISSNVQLNRRRSRISSTLIVESDSKYLAIRDEIENLKCTLFPTLEIRTGQREVTLLGDMDHVLAARPIIKDKLDSVKMVCVTNVPYASMALSLWHKEDISKKIFGGEAGGRVIVDTSRGVCLYASSSAMLDRAQHVLSQVLKESVVEIREGQGIILETLKNLLKDLQLKRKIVTTLQNETWLSLVGFREDVDENVKWIEDYLRQHTLTKETFNMGINGIAENLDYFIQNLQIGPIPATVEIPSDQDQTITLIGSEEDVAKSKDVLKQVLEKLCQKHLSIKKHGAKHYFKNKGNEELDRIAKQYKCRVTVICDEEIPEVTEIMASASKSKAKDTYQKVNIDKTNPYTSNSKQSDQREAAASYRNTDKQPIAGATKHLSPVQLILIQGKLEEQKADIFIAPLLSTNPSLACLNITKDLELKAGSHFSNLFSNLCTNCKYLNPGSLLQMNVTGNNYGINCDMVIFIACTPWNGSDGSSVKDLRKGISSVLEKCKGKADSLAMPPIGPGLALKFPSMTSATILGEEVKSFVTKEPTTPLRKIHIVIPQDNQMLFSVYKDTLLQMDLGDQIVVCNRDGEPFQAPSLSEELKFEIGRLSVYVVYGNIVTESTDVIVNSTNFYQWSKQSVAHAIFTAGGKEIVKEAQGKACGKKPVMTTAGKLKCKWIFHCDCQKDIENIKIFIKDILIESDKMGLSSVALPAIGTGECGLDPQIVAKCTIDVISSLARNVELSVLSCVRLIAFKPHIYSIFCIAAQERFKPVCDYSWNVQAVLASRLKKQPTPQTEAINDIDIFEHPFPHQPEVLLNIIGSRIEDVSAVEVYLNELFERNYEEQKIEEPLLYRFSLEEIQKLFSLVREKPGVQMILDRVKKCIFLNGCNTDVTEVYLKVQESLREILHVRLQEANKERAGLLVQWGYYDGSEMVAFEVNASQLLEDKFLNKDDVDITVQLADGKQAKVNLNTMKALLDGMGEEVTVVRKDLEADIHLPENWEDMNGRFLMLVRLDPNSAEYQGVHSGFVRTAKNIFVEKIERIQNRYQYTAYTLRKDYIRKKNGSSEVNERTLYHGTQHQNCNSINSNGFNRSFAGTNAAYFGNGVYFAVNASYSTRHTYSPPDPATGRRYVYQVKMLTGRYARGEMGLRAPPSRSGNDPYDQYDSIVDNLHNPSMFVAFHDNQVYPEYLITFT